MMSMESLASKTTTLNANERSSNQGESTGKILAKQKLIYYEIFCYDPSSRLTGKTYTAPNAFAGLTVVLQQ